MNWKGLPLFKTAFDFAIYAMLLWELKPATVIEIGSGAGGSAVWMADLMVAYGSPARVLSFDLNVPTDCSHEHVSFLHGDANEMSSVLSEAEVADLPHPWLVVEDAHVNVRGVLEAFDSYLAKGDYVVVEDSWMNERDISEFLEGRLESYRVDTALTDFFGRNVTCAQDSIFVRVA